MAQLPEKIIDFHVHLFPNGLFDAIWKAFVKDYNWDVIHKLYTPGCIEYLRERGVERIVYSNYAHKPGVAEGLNQWNAALLEQYENLYCFAAYHPGDDSALAMAEKVLNTPRFLGFKLQLLVQNFYPHDERLFPLYEMVIEKKKRILFHVGTAPVGNEYVGLKYFVRLMKRYPNLRANVAHMGGYEYQGFIDLLDEYPNLYLDTTYSFFSKGDGGFNLPAEYLERYKDRILYGSDFPNLIFPRKDEINTLLNLDLSDEFYRKIFYENGLALLTE
ncbi:MAG: amidohydrolase family protein [bacterium]|nr:amidohydrolase family protein [bacterium]